MLYTTARLNLEYLKQLEKFITDKNNPQVFFRMTSVNKLHPDYRAGWITPTGICAYPFTKEYYDQLISNTLPASSDKRFIQVFTISAPLIDVSNFSSSDLQQKVDLLKSNLDLTDEFIKNAFDKAKKDNPFSKLYALTEAIAGEKNGLKWGGLFKQLGMSNLYDPGTGSLSHAVTNQIIIFDSSIIQMIETFYNPAPIFHPSETSYGDPGRSMSRAEVNMFKQRSRQEYRKNRPDIFTIKDYSDPDVKFPYLLKKRIGTKNYLPTIHKMNDLFDKLYNSKSVEEDAEIELEIKEFIKPFKDIFEKYRLNNHTIDQALLMMKEQRDAETGRKNSQASLISKINLFYKLATVNYS